MKKFSLLLLSMVLLFCACNSSKKFDENLKIAHEKTIKPLILADYITNEISETWRTAIYDHKDSHGKYCSDFNQALKTLFEDYKTKGVLDTLNMAKRDLKLATEHLSEYPDDRKDAFEAFVSIVTDVTTLCDMASDPSGSFTSYNQDINNVKRDIKRKMDEFSIKYSSCLKEE